ncbi:hypothetical protein RZR10_22510, partial [Enterobacter asburiae]|nr:hypothetical protein [Enterobacter asburiae]
IGPDPRNFNQRVSLGRNDLLIRTFLLTRLGCDYLQGYLFSRPLPAEQVPWLLLQINSDKQIIPINKIQTDPAFISQKNHA